MIPVEAVYETGVFRPITPVPESLRDGTRVLVEPLEPPASDNEHKRPHFAKYSPAVTGPGFRTRLPGTTSTSHEGRLSRYRRPPGTVG
jgi:hypothetical protein